MFFVVRLVITRAKYAAVKERKHLTFWTAVPEKEFAFGARYAAEGYDTLDEAYNEGLQAASDFVNHNYSVWSKPFLKVVEEYEPGRYDDRSSISSS